MRALFARTILFARWKCCSLLIVFAGINILAVSAPGDPATKPVLKLYVSTVGNNNWSGKLSEPNRNKTDGPLQP